MQGGLSATQRVRFGLFETDLGTAELFKNGHRQKLQEQPFRLLALLLEKPGEVVSREQLRNALWADDTFVDFEHSMNATVAKLRQALGDSADNPRFIATVPRRGYRFIAPVISCGAAGSGLEAVATLENRATKRKRMLWMGSSAAAIAAIATGVFVYKAAQPRFPTSRNGKLHRLTSDAGLTTEPAVSRDGKLLAYASDRGGNGHMSIWLQQLAGGDTIRLTHGDADEREPSFSPDGSQIVYRSEMDGGAIYVVPALGGQPRRLAEKGRRPRFSPDGKWIAYWVGFEWGTGLGVARGQTYVIAASGGEPRALTTALMISGMPVWSPDSKHILVIGELKETRHFLDDIDWWLIPIQGGTPVRTGAYPKFLRQGLGVAKLLSMPYPADWIGDKVVFSGRYGDAVDLWQATIRPGSWQFTGDAERLTSLADEGMYGLKTQDGHCVFAKLSERTHLWKLPLASDGEAGGDATQITDSAAAEYWPSIPQDDDSKMVFTATRAGPGELWLKDLRTGAETRLPSNAAKLEFPSISRDGRQVAYTGIDSAPAATGGQRAAIYVLSLDTMRIRKLIDRGDWVWNWSPDGTTLFCKWGVLRNIQALDVKSGRNWEFLGAKDGHIYQPMASRDGRWIVFMDLNGILVAPYSGPQPIPSEKWTRITSGEGFDDKPRWRADQAAIFFISHRDGSECLWQQRVNAVTKKPEGMPQAVYHSHNARQSLTNVGNGFSELAVTRDAIIFPQTELKGNIWIAEPNAPVN